MKKDISLEHLRHSLAHLLGASILKLWPESKLTLGPAIENGFYYDVDSEHKISEEDLPTIEKKMKELLKEWKEFPGREVNVNEAREIYKDNSFKLELVNEIEKRGEKITLYTAGEFTDLCRGGHVEHGKDINPKAFKLSHVAGAYWRGKSENPMLQRVYGLAFAEPEELAAYLKMMEEAEKRDHRKLGPHFELFMFHETAPGMPYWLPRGVILYNELIRFWRDEHQARGYQEIVSPILNKKELYVTSGHYEHYWPDMFVAQTPEKEEYGVKAMNCPNAMIVFGWKPRSYRELPLRLSDTDPLHRHELSGTLNGLLRVREFRQDDAHVFVTEDQIGEEYRKIFSIVERFYSIFDMKYTFRLGTRPESFMGDVETWNQAETTLKKILSESGEVYSVAEGDGAFYGPKVDILMKDALGREWQMGTVQLDFQQPRRFELEYAAADGSKKTPVAIHRVIYGSLERFIGILIEHYAGDFPIWLTPVQVAVLPVGETHIAACKNLMERLEQQGFRVELDESNETVGKKIRNAEMMKIPYALVIGDKEAPIDGQWGDSTTLAVRVRGTKELMTVSLGDFVARVKKQTNERRDTALE